MSDANPKNTFNLDKHINRKLVVKPTDEFEYFEFEPADEELPTEVLADDFLHEHDFEEDLEPI